MYDHKYFELVKRDDYITIARCGRPTENCDVMCARLFNLDYDDFLLFCVELFDAKLKKESDGFIHPCFHHSVHLAQMITFLNNRANLIEWNNTHKKESTDDRQ